MNRREFLGTLVGTAAVSAFSGASGCAAEILEKVADSNARSAAKPNMIFILIDDLGPEWISCYGADDIKTPNVDALAAGGMKFTNAYSMAQCTPSRTTLLTGRYPFKTGWVNHFDVPRWGKGCHFDWKHNVTFATMMKNAGYVTATAGKWQINDFRVTPDAMVKHGFDEYCMWTGGEAGNVEVSDKRYWDPYIHTKEGSKTYKGQFGEEVFTSFLIEFMRKNKDKPMMVYYPMTLTHFPLTTTPLEPNATGKMEQHRAMVRYVDYCLKRIVDALDELEIRRNTIIFWTTDNGTAGPIIGHIKGREVKGGKATIGENGMCEPFIVNCPGLVPAGATTDTLTDFTDMLPTFAELGGAELPKDVAIDGHSIAKVILGKEKDGTRQWILGMGHGEAGFKDGWVVGQHSFEERGIRDKQYKMHISYDRVCTKLYDLQADPGEKNNLIDSDEPEHMAAKQKFEAVLKMFPEKDAPLEYNKLPEQEWEKVSSLPKRKRKK